MVALPTCKQPLRMVGTAFTALQRLQQPVGQAVQTALRVVSQHHPDVCHQQRTLALLARTRIALPSDSRPPEDVPETSAPAGKPMPADEDKEVRTVNMTINVNLENPAFARGASPWPFFSDLDERLSSNTAGRAWPFHLPNDRDSVAELLEDGVIDDLSPLDLALLASTATDLPDGPDRDAAVKRLRMPSVVLQLPTCSLGVLSSMVRNLSALPASAGCGKLLQNAATELAKRVPLRPWHATVLLGALCTRVSAGGTLPGAILAAPALQAAAAADRPTEHQDSGELTLANKDVLNALEGLASVRHGPADGAVDKFLMGAALKLSSWLKGGNCIVRFLTGPGRIPHLRGFTLRYLAALRDLPEVTSQGHLAASLASMRGLRWPRGLPDDVTEEIVAAAACSLARCGGAGSWKGTGCSHLLARVLRRCSSQHMHVGEAEGTDSVATMHPVVSSLWLCALAQAGQDLETAVEGIPGADALEGRAEQAILGGVEALVTVQPDDASPGDLAAVARTLWALHTLGKAGERENLGKKLLSMLAAADAALFPAEVWALLREVQVMVSPTSSGEQQEDGQTENPFRCEAWENGLAMAAQREAHRLEASLRIAELRAMLPANGDMLGDHAFGEVEENIPCGPFTLAVQVGSHGVALDFDAHESYVNRALRRQQWATHVPDLRVEEVSLATFDRHNGLYRTDLLRRRILGLPDDDNEEEDD